MASSAATRISLNRAGRRYRGNAGRIHRRPTAFPLPARLRRECAPLTPWPREYECGCRRARAPQTRQSPSSSRVCSITMVRSSGTWPWLRPDRREKRRRFSRDGIEIVLADQPGERSGRGQSAHFANQAPIAAAKLQRRRPVALPKGILPARRGAGATSTRSCVISTMRHVDAPRIEVFARDGTRRPFLHRVRRRDRFFLAVARKTPYRPRSGMVPAFRIASRAAPWRAVTTLRMRSQVSRGRQFAKLIGR